MCSHSPPHLHQSEERLRLDEFFITIEHLSFRLPKGDVKPKSFVEMCCSESFSDYSYKRILIKKCVISEFLPDLPDLLDFYAFYFMN